MSKILDHALRVGVIAGLFGAILGFVDTTGMDLVPLVYDTAGDELGLAAILLFLGLILGVVVTGISYRLGQHVAFHRMG